MRALTSVVRRPVRPSAGFDLWARTYDDEPDNLLLHLDQQIMRTRIPSLHLAGSLVLDVGCGTGRYWKRLKQESPSRLIGCDVSENMLKILRSKHLDAELYLVEDELLPFLEKGQCDVITCNLVFGYFPSARRVLTEWDRVLRSGAEVLITDLHPAQIQNGATRSFSFDGRAVEIECHSHAITKLEGLYDSLHWDWVDRREIVVDEKSRPFYLRAGDEDAYDRAKGQPILYFHHLRKQTIGIPES